VPEGRLEVVGHGEATNFPHLSQGIENGGKGSLQEK